jgi:hypothetical protein
LKEWPQQATHDRAKLREWANQYEGCNWAVACGLASGIFVVDVDGDEGAAAIRELCREHGEDWLETLTAVTHRGRHFYFEYPEGMAIRNSVGKLAVGLDIRSENGYVVIPPSMHPSGNQYKWENANASIAPAPQWLLQMVASTTPDGEKKNRDQIDVLRPGQRNDTLMRYAGALRRKGMPQGEIEIALLTANARRCCPPLPEEELHAIAESVGRYPSGGPDPLEAAWQASEGQYPSRRERFLALTRQLQTSRPGKPIALPLKRIAELMGVHWTMVGLYRKEAVKAGLLEPDKQYSFKCRRAGTYRLVEPSPLVRVERSLNTLTTLTSSNYGLVRVPPSESPPSESVPQKAEPESKPGGYVEVEL